MGCGSGHALDAGELADETCPPTGESTRRARRRSAARAVGGGEAHAHRHRLARGGGVEPGDVAAGARPGERLHRGHGRDALEPRLLAGRRSRARARAPPPASRRRPRRPAVVSKRPRTRPRHVLRDACASGRRSPPPACRGRAARAGSRPPSRSRPRACAISTRAGRTRLAMSWLWASRSCFGDEVHLQVGAGGGIAAGSSGGRGR